MTEETLRTWKIFGYALFGTAVVVIFLTGMFPLQKLISRSIPNPCELTAAVLPTDVISLTNENRTDDALPTLTISPLLMEAAQDKANDMAEHSYYAHVSPDGKTPLYWLDAVGYKYLNAGENLVIDRTTAEQVVDAWMDSPDHRENILRPQFTEIGVGVAQGTFEGQDTIYVVQEFGTPYPTPATVAASHASSAHSGSSNSASVAAAHTTQSVTVTKTTTVSTPAAATKALPSTAPAVAPATTPATPAKTTDALEQGSVVLSTAITQSLPVSTLVPVLHTAATAPTIQSTARSAPTITEASTSVEATTSDVRFFLPLTSADPVALLATGKEAEASGSCGG